MTATNHREESKDRGNSVQALCFDNEIHWENSVDLYGFPVAIVEAPGGLVWRNLTQWERYCDWAGAWVNRSEPDGPAGVGQTIHASESEVRDEIDEGIDPKGGESYVILHPISFIRR